MNNLKRIIDEKGVQQRWLAEQVGVTEVSMSRYISGKRIPKATLAIRIADVLGVDVKELYEWEPEKRTEERAETHACVLIDRQAAVDALGEGAMVNYQAAGNDNGLIKAINVIKGLPSAEPQIIRCKECKHWTNNIGDSKLRDNYCNEAVHGFYYRCSGDDYCSFAERRTDER